MARATRRNLGEAEAEAVETTESTVQDVPQTQPEAVQEQTQAEAAQPEAAEAAHARKRAAPHRAIIPGFPKFVREATGLSLRKGARRALLDAGECYLGRVAQHARALRGSRRTVSVADALGATSVTLHHQMLGSALPFIRERVRTHKALVDARAQQTKERKAAAQVQA